MIKLSKRGHNATVTSVDEDNDRGWMERFVVVAPEDILLASASASPIPEAWNYSRKLSQMSLFFTILKVFSLFIKISFLLFYPPFGLPQQLRTKPNGFKINLILPHRIPVCERKF